MSQRSDLSAVSGLLEEDAQDLYDNAPCGYLSTLPDGTIIKVNATFLEWTGYERSFLLGKKRFQELLPVAGRVFHDTHFGPLLLMQGVVKELAFEIVCNDGVRLPVLLNSALKRDDAGNPLVIRTTLLDARSRRSYEEELRRAKQKAEKAEVSVRQLADRLAEIFRQAPAFMCVLHGPDHVFEIVNDRYLQLVGNRNLVGQPVRQALPEIEGQGFFEILDRVYETGETFTGMDMPVLLQRSPGDPLEMRFIELVYLALRDVNGIVTGILVHGVDQTNRKLAELDLYDSRERFRKIVSQAGTGVVEANAEGRITLANQKYCEMLGYAEAELLGKSITDVTAPASVRQTVGAVAELAAGGSDFVIEKQYRRKDGSVLWATSSVSALRSPDGEYQGVVAVVVDITERKWAETALREETEKLQLATEAAELGLFDHDLTRGEVNWSSKLREQFDVSSDIKITRELFYSRLHPEDREHVRGVLDALVLPGSDGRYQAEYRVLLANDRVRWLTARGRVHYDEAGAPVRLLGTTIDITERRCIEKQIQEAGQHDSLTGLPNRALLYEYCNHVLAMSARFGEPGAILFIDLDRFKPINDLYGHDVGDKVLQEVAQRLLRCSRKEDIVSRLGGDEFIVVLPRIISSEDPKVMAQHMLEAIAAPISIGTLHLSVSPSIGISLFPEHGSDLELLVRCADLAMYAAKRDGRNTFRVYSARLNDDAKGILRLEILLKHALETNRLALFYQPILDVQSRAPVGAEALIRIPSEGGALLGPTEFIPVAEAAGLMNRIGEWVMREACRQHRRWLGSGLPPITIAVNVSPTQFRQAGFVSVLDSAIQEFGVTPSAIQIEVTESTLMENVPEAVATLNQLQSMGIKIALDDFGTGYSSLSRLSSLPLSKLKIDQSFIRKMASSQNSRSITEAIIGLGRTLNLKVVAEGIESEATMDLLRSYGCDQVQGFLFSKPLPAAEFESWYRHRLAQFQS